MGIQVDLFTGEDALPPPDPALDQWFTRPKVADAFARWAGIRSGMRVLEPSAGEGALIKAAPDAIWTAVEIDPPRAKWIASHGWCERVVCGDFLQVAFELEERFDLVHQNPPYSNDLDTRFVEAWLDSRIAPRTTGLLVTNFLHSDKRAERIWRWVRLARLGILTTRPQFGEAGGSADGPKRDYSFFELALRDKPRRAGAHDSPKVSWIDIPN